MPASAFGAAGVALTLAMFLPYLRLVWRGTAKPHVFSWVIWALGTFVVFFAQLAGGAGVGAWPIGVSAAITTAVALLAWVRHADTGATRTDWAFFLAAVSALPCWLVTADPLSAVVILTLVDLLGFGPTVRRGWARPHEESAGFFALAALRNLLVVLALERVDATTVLFPAAVGLGCALLATLLAVRRRALATGAGGSPMPLRDADFDRAFCEWQEFGPRRGVPIVERWRAMFPHATPAVLEDAERRCREIEAAAWQLAEAVQAGRMGEAEGQRRLAAQYPRLTASRVGRIWIQAMYFVAK